MPPRSAFLRTLVVAAIVLFVAGPLVAPALAAPATPAPPRAASPTVEGLVGTPDLPSAYIVDHGAALVFVGAETWTATWVSEGNGSQVYSNALILIAYDLLAVNFSLPVDAYEQDYGWVSNTSSPMTPLAETVITVPFAEDTSWRNVVLDVGGTPARGGEMWEGQIATPFSLIPPSVLNVGGLDILALGIISESIACFVGMVGLAKMLMMRGRWAPKFSLLIWGHVVVVGILAAVILDYQWVNETFAGWSPLVYAFAVSPMVLMTALSWFNRSRKAELLQRVAKPEGHILYRRWLLRYSTLADGRTVLVDERWRGLLARIFGAYAVLSKGDESEPEVFEGMVRMMKSPTRTHGEEHIADRFKVANPQEDDVDVLWWTETGDPITVEWPHLTWHKEVSVEAQTSPEGNVLVKAHTKKVLTVPHYTAAKVELRRALEDYEAVEAVSARWANTRDLGRVLSKVKTALYAIKAAFSANVEAEVEARLVAYYSLTNRMAADLTDEEAENLAKKGASAPSLAELLDEVRLRGGHPPAPKSGTSGG